MLAKRSLGAVTLRYRINGGPVQSARRASGTGGERYGAGNGTYYHVVRGTVTGTDPGRQGQGVVHGRRRDERLVHLRRRLRQRPPRAGRWRPRTTRARRRSSRREARTTCRSTTDALTANGVAFDVYDVDAHGRTAPDNLGVLSHYDAVVWYTGDDVVTREPGWGPGQRVAAGDAGAARGARLRQRGRARALHGPARPASSTRRASARSCTTRSRTASAAPTRPSRRAAWPCRDPATRRATRSSTCSARRSPRRTAAATRTPGEPFDVAGIDDPLAGLTWGFNGADSAQNQATNSSFIATGDFLAGHRPGGQLPAVRELAGGRVPERPRRVRSTRTRGSRSCGRIAPTRPTSA